MSRNEGSTEMKPQPIKAEANRDKPASVLVVEMAERTDDYNTESTIEEISERWAAIWNGEPPIPIFVLPPGCAVGVVQISGEDVG